MSIDDTRLTPLRIGPHMRTPCCDRIPGHVRDAIYACRKCGTMYVDQAALIRAAFPGTVDVTTMTPRRFFERSPDA